MIETREIPDDDAVENLPEGPAPLIVIEYRKPGLLSRLVPPLLVVLVAVAIANFQRSGRDRRFAVPRNVVSTPPSVEPVSSKVVVKAVRREDEEGMARDQAVTKAVAPVSVPAVPPKEPPKVDAPSLAKIEEGSPSPFELDGKDGLKPLPAAGIVVETTPVAPPEPIVLANGPKEGGEETPEVSKDEILRDIQREAEGKEARQQDMADLKPKAEAMLAAEMGAKTEENRAGFHKELQKVLKALGNGAGPEIDKLCDQFGRDTPDNIRAAFARATRNAPKRISRQSMVEMMRSIGLPEPVILDYLAHAIHKSINTRGGPRDEDEVRVRAARTLIAFPLNTKKSGDGTAVARPVSEPHPAPAP